MHLFDTVAMHCECYLKELPVVLESEDEPMEITPAKGKKAVLAKTAPVKVTPAKAAKEDSEDEEDDDEEEDDDDEEDDEEEEGELAISEVPQSSQNIAVALPSALVLELEMMNSR